MREIKTEDMALREKILVNESQGEVIFELLNHPLFVGTVVHSLRPPEGSQSAPVLTITMNWRPLNPEGEAVEKGAGQDIQVGIEEAVKFLKAVAERQGAMD